MSKCIDCLHYEICEAYSPRDSYATLHCAEECVCFTDRSEWVHLPCKVEDKVYALYNGKVLKANIFSMKIETEDDKYVYMLKLKIFDHFFQFKTFLLGKTVFLTREEAENALKE